MPEQAEWDDEDMTYPPVRSPLPDVRTGPQKLADSVTELALAVLKLTDRVQRLEAAQGMVSDAK